MSHAARLGSGPRERPRVAYVVKRFPRISETFILNEILELERHGLPIEIFSLLEPADELRHEALKQVRAPVTYLANDGSLRDWQLREARYDHEASLSRSFGTFFPDEHRLDVAVLTLKAAGLAVMARLRGVEHLHAHFATAATTVAMLASRVAGIPYSFTAHAKDIYHEYVDLALLREKIRHARFIITVSEYNRRHLADLSGADLSSRIIRLYNGIDLTLFRADPSTPREPHLILAVGRLIEKKGFHHLVRACRFLEEWQRPFRCLIIGSGPDKVSLVAQIRTLGLQDRVSLVDAQSQIQLVETMKRATVLVLPCVVAATGDRDGLPTVLLEALAVGLPAISTTLGGIPEIIEHGRSGLLVPPGDALHLARAVERVLTDATLRERLGRRGRARAEALFDVRKNALVIQDLFAASVAGRGRLDEAVLDEDRLSVGR